jgi:2-C-methyl-D-erythritol 4-phosphate cytidylyltransferase
MGDPLVCIHDSVRPFIKPALIRELVDAANHWNAAALGVRAKSTIKFCEADQTVIETLPRNNLWEIQTPQVIRLQLLKEGFVFAQNHRMSVTDDVSLVELLGKPVKIVEGCYDNIKVTTQEDLNFVQKIMTTDVFV